MTDRIKISPIAYEEVETCDKRRLRSESLTWPNKPVRLMFSVDGTMEPVGEAHTFQRSGTLITATLDFELSPAGADALRLFTQEHRMPELGLSSVEIHEPDDPEAVLLGDFVLDLTAGTVSHVTISAKGSAWQEHAEAAGDWPLTD